MSQRECYVSEFSPSWLIVSVFTKEFCFNLLKVREEGSKVRGNLSCDLFVTVTEMLGERNLLKKIQLLSAREPGGFLSYLLRS